MFLNFIGWLVEVVLLYTSPLFSSLKALREGTEASTLRHWMIHWILVAVAHLSVYPVLNLISNEAVQVTLRIIVVVAIYFLNPLASSHIETLFLAEDSYLHKMETNLRSTLKAQLIKFGLVE